MNVGDLFDALKDKPRDMVVLVANSNGVAYSDYLESVRVVSIPVIGNEIEGWYDHSPFPATDPDNAVLIH